MSIPNLFHKIKAYTGIDKQTALFLCIIIGVGMCSFGLGRLSVDNSIVQDEDIIIKTSQNSPIEGQNTLNGIDGLDNGEIADRRYVASKNGKLYYSKNCSGASRIKIENQIWFSTKEDAEKSGFTLASSCQ
jgi:hypothetical protein